MNSSMVADAPIRQRFQDALEHLVEQLKQDRYILAAILCGSLSYDEVWEKSDIDLLLVCSEDLKASKGVTLSADGIPVHAMLFPRGKFKVGLQSATQSSFFHSFFSKSTLLFSHDESLEDLYHNIHHLGARDREIQLLRAATLVLPHLTKAEKWLYVKADVHYCFFWILKTVEALAAVEVVQQSEIASREVVQQALRLNPRFFKRVYTDLIEGEKTLDAMKAALDAINEYLSERIWIFQPIFDYLDDAHGIRSATEIGHYFQQEMGIESADFACEWLADQGIVQQVGSPVRLTPRSRVTVEEAAYHYDKP